MKKTNFLVFATLILAVVFARLLPHPPNFSPLIATSLFAGLFLRKNLWAAVAVNLTGLLISDFFLGFYGSMWVVYLSLALISLFGEKTFKDTKLASLAGAGVAGSVFFFATTNFSVWFYGGIYPKTLEGLWASYVAGLPFFQNTLASTFFYGAILVGSYKAIQKMLPEWVEA